MKNKITLYKQIKWKLENIWTFIRNIPDNIIMICQWIPILWDNWDWDYNFLFKIMEYKLTRMADHIEKHDRHTNGHKHVKQMRTCAALINRIRKDNYTEIEENHHHEKWGELRMDSIPEEDNTLFHTLDIYYTKAREQGKEEQERKEIIEIHSLQEKRRESDIKALFDTMSKKIIYWWD